MLIEIFKYFIGACNTIYFFPTVSIFNVPVREWDSRENIRTIHRAKEKAVHDWMRALLTGYSYLFRRGFGEFCLDLPGEIPRKSERQVMAFSQESGLQEFERNCGSIIILVQVPYVSKNINNKLLMAVELVREWKEWMDGNKEECAAKDGRRPSPIGTLLPEGPGTYPGYPTEGLARTSPQKDTPGELIAVNVKFIHVSSIQLSCSEQRVVRVTFTNGCPPRRQLAFQFATKQWTAPRGASPSLSKPSAK